MTRATLAEPVGWGEPGTVRHAERIGHDGGAAVPLWDLDDLAGVVDLAAEYCVGRSTVCSWVVRFADFPAPLARISAAPIYSRAQVRSWHDSRDWMPGKHDRRPTDGGTR